MAAGPEVKVIIRVGLNLPAALIEPWVEGVRAPEDLCQEEIAVALGHAGNDEIRGLDHDLLISLKRLKERRLG